ncbi:hypothetical protein B484DRAFT_402169 [Ochromonadaceae sp. CCMP2298]|nr:hypothetical protein B484DRAFT_402169 [Ochromonadaceae sp. CCMP2298]
MFSEDQFVTRSDRGLTSHSTITSNIVPDHYPVLLDCLLPRVQLPIYGCTSAASIHALPPHIKFNLTAPQIQQLYSVGINPYPREAPAVSTSTEPALSAAPINQPTLATATGTPLAAARTSTAPSGRPFVPPVERRPSAQGASSNTDPTRARASHRATSGAPQPTFAAEGHPAARHPEPL